MEQPPITSFSSAAPTVQTSSPATTPLSSSAASPHVFSSPVVAGEHTLFNPHNTPFLQPESDAASVSAAAAIISFSHSSSHLPQINKHQLPILAYAYDVVSPRSRSFQLCWWLQHMSISTCSCRRWYLSSGKSALSSLETIGPTYSDCSPFLPIHESSAPCCWLPNFLFCLMHFWASSCFHLKLSYYATSWLSLGSSTGWWINDSIYAKS
jgi:hypothetical protein